MTNIIFKWLLLFLYPLALLITTPLRLIQALLSLRSIANESLRAFARMSAYRSLNSSWHRAYDFLMEKYGRNGYAYDVSLGWNLATHFSLTRFSMRLYRHNEIIIPWLGILFMVLSQLMWLSSELNAWMVSATILLGLISTLFYYTAFEAIKYDSLAWALVPLGYYALLTGNLLFFSFLFLAITFLSVSVTIVQGAVWLVIGIAMHEWWILPAFLPGGFKLLNHFKFVFVGNNLSAVNAISSLIGLSGSGANLRNMRFGKTGWYFITLWIMFMLAILIFEQSSNYLPYKIQIILSGLTIILYILNKRFRRFADEQTLYLLIFCAFSLIAMNIANGLLLLFLWLALSPMPYMLSFTDDTKDRKLVWWVPKKRPYRLEDACAYVSKFLEPIKENQRILFHFDYDQSIYPDFEGLKAIKELIQYIFLKRQAFIVPDYYLVADSYAGRFPLAEILKDSSPFGRLKAMEHIGAHFLLLPSDGSELSQEWIRAGFIKRSQLDMQDGCRRNLWGPNAFRSEKPYLYLLEATTLPEISLTVTGAIISMQPNYMRIQLNDKGEAILRFLYNDGWKSDSNIEIARSAGFIPWMHIYGEANSLVDIGFKFYSNYSLSSLFSPQKKHC